MIHAAGEKALACSEISPRERSWSFTATERGVVRKLKGAQQHGQDHTAVPGRLFIPPPTCVVSYNVVSFAGGGFSAHNIR